MVQSHHHLVLLRCRMIILHNCLVPLDRLLIPPNHRLVLLSPTMINENFNVAVNLIVELNFP